MNVSPISISLSSFAAALNIALEIQAESGPKLVDWKRVLETSDKFQEKLRTLREEMEAFANEFPLPGHDVY